MGDQVLSSGVTDVEMPEKLTIVDIARKAGVSIRTVSRVLNDSPFVNAETRDRIKSIIESTSYSPNSRARGLASNRSYLIGLVHDDPMDLCWTRFSEASSMFAPRMPTNW